MKPLLITIDGPAGAGKTTISKILAEKLGYRYLDTGALYRAVALKVVENNVDIGHDAELVQLCESLDLQFVQENGATHLICNGRDVTDLIRTEKISMTASKVSANPIVREALLDLQRAIGKNKAVVAEGRDMGTVVFADADVKFFLDALPETRAKRRYKEMCPESSSTLEQVEKQIRQRDQNDSSRQLAPLKVASDAIRIDSTSLSIDQVTEQMLKYIFKRF
ncbi:MAG: (d)CMP kinase [Desulfobacterales bacterium]